MAWAVKLLLCVSANWDVWGVGKLVDHWSKESYWEIKDKEGKRRQVTNRAAGRGFAAAKQVAALTMWHVCHLKMGAQRSCQPPTILLFLSRALSVILLQTRQALLTCCYSLKWAVLVPGAAEEKERKREERNVKAPVWTLLWREWQHAFAGDTLALLLSPLWTQQVPASLWN